MKRCVFYSNRIRTLVAMATYSSHRLIMGQEEIDSIFSVSFGIFRFFFTEMFIEYSSMFHTSFVQIGEFDWLSGQLKASIFVKMFKNLLLRNHKVKEPKFAKDISLYRYISCVFYSGRIRTLVAMATYSSHRLIMGQEEIDSFCCLTGDI